MANRRFPKLPLAVLLLFIILGSTLVFFPVAVFAQPVACNTTITANTTLPANIGPCSGNGIVVGTNGITLDCAGHTISGRSSQTGKGIYLDGRTNVKVGNCNVAAFHYGFDLQGSSNNTLSGNTVNRQQLQWLLPLRLLQQHS